MVPGQEGTSGVNINWRARRVMVSADGTGLVSRAGTLLLRELTVETGLAAGWTEALLEQTRPGKAQPCRCPVPYQLARQQQADVRLSAATVEIFVICRGGCWRTWR